MKAEIKVSVIIPVYNVEKYIHQCVDSVLCQTYPNLEVILVDDGSPDHCPAICDAYARQDSRILVIHKENGGLSDARNTGIAKATGDYVLFMDSDDYWLCPSGVAALVARVLKTGADVLSFSYVKLEEESGKKHPMLQRAESMPLGLKTKAEQLNYLTRNALYVASACNKLIQIEQIRQVPFEVGKVSEDVEWAARLMSSAHSFDFLNISLYCYRQRTGSISQGLSLKSCEHLKDAVVGCCEAWALCDESIKESLGRYAAYQFATFIAVQALAPQFPREMIHELEEYASILQYYGASRKVKYLYFGVRAVGLLLWCRLIRMTKFIWNTRRDKI